MSRADEAGARVREAMEAHAKFWPTDARSYVPIRYDDLVALMEQPPATPDPKSEAVMGLVEMLRLACDTLRSYADPSGYTDNYGELYTAEDPAHPGLLAQHTLDRIAAFKAASEGDRG